MELRKTTHAAIAAGLSLTLAMGCTPAIAFAEGDEDSSNQSNEQAATVEVSVYYYDETDWYQWSNETLTVGASISGSVNPPEGYTVVSAMNDYGYDVVNADTTQVQVKVQKTAEPSEEVNWYTVYYYDEDGTLYGTGMAQNGTTNWDNTVIPSKEGYTFVGWKYESTGEFVDSNTEAMPANDVTLIAVWKPAVEVVTRTVTFYVDGYEAFATAEVEEGELLTAVEAPEKPGYTFLGWKYTGATDDQLIDFNLVTMGTSDISLQAVYQANASYSVTYYDEGYEPIYVGEAVAGTYGWGSYTPETKAGYEFVGWKFVGAEDTDIIDFATTAMPAADTYLQAVWKEAAAVTHTVTYYDEGYEPVATLEVAEGDALTNVTLPTKEGYTFAGWKYVGADDNDLIDFATATMGTADISLQAVWKANEAAATYTIEYYDADGSTLLGTAEAYEGSYNWDYITPAAKEGYTFVGWKYVEDEDTNIIDFATTPMPAYNVSLQAVWEANDPEAVVYTVTVVDNFNETSYTVDVKEGELMEQPTNPYFEGYTFYGWSSSLDEYAAYDFSQPVTGDLTIYAFYTQNAAADDADQATEQTQEPVSEPVEEADVLPQTGDNTLGLAAGAAAAAAAAVAAGSVALKRRRDN